nr:integrase, catalytic region, zinc finger, CCHC-type, peptidase aspartic, catalytic [Tanacetum cinerariifolium]
MSNQQDIYAAGSESRPPMLNKENYVPWSSRLLRYARSRPNGKLIHNSILNGPYVRQMIPELGDANREVNVTETFHLQTDDELSEKKLKQIEADDQAIQTILLGLPEDIYAAVDSCETAQEIWLRVQQMMKGSDIGIQEKKAKLFNEWERFTSNEGESIESYYHRFLNLMNDLKRNKHFPEKIASNLKFLNNLQPEWSRHEVDELKAEQLAKTQDPLALMANSNNPYAFPAPHQDQSSFNQNYLQQPMPNPEDITDPTTVMNLAIALMAKAFKLNYSTPTNNNQRISSNPKNRHIAQPGMNIGQDRKIQMNAVQNIRIQNIGNQNGLIGVQGNENQNQIGNGNLVAARAKGNAAGQNGNQIRCYNCRGVGHYARNYTGRPRRRDDAYLQTQLLIAQEEEAGIQLQVEEKHQPRVLRLTTLPSMTQTDQLSGKKQKAKVSVKEIQMKYQPKVAKPKKVGTLERLATLKPRKPRFLLRWSPIRRLFDQEGKLAASSKSESQYDCSNGDNACTSNAMEPKIKRFPNSTSLLDSVRFENDHVAAILGFGDLQWGNILITRVYFVEGLGHNLFSVGQFCDSNLEVAFRRNACFVRNLEGADLLK